MDIKKLFLSFNVDDFFSKVNLHIHSNYSDGEEDFDKLIDDAVKSDMKYISITDHNCISGYEKSKYKNHSILIPGVEFDCFYQTSPLHILGYGINIEDEKLRALCAKNEKECKDDFLRLIKSRHPKKVIDTIHNAGGIAIFAHPCCTFTLSLDNYTKGLKKFGLDGIETYYPYDRFRKILKFSSKKLPFDLSKKYDLIKTGGSDEHGKLIN